jgi:hypothetical protein
MSQPLHEGFPVAPLSRARIRAAAVHARRILELPDGRINIPRLLDELSQFGIHYDVFDQKSEPVPRGVEACYVPEDRTLYIRDTVYTEMEKGGYRSRFTFGHELGHAVLAHRRTLNRQSDLQIPIYCESEWQANCFAAEFIMPLTEIVKFNLYSVDAIAEHFGVSPAAARVRLDDLTRKGELRKKP